ncbi:S26 family signal peptidase [Fimbriiglobus ruber]|uniref:Signal peptidase I n=1 Tax=Fimbriiglobus ruber TaxID=1908690 RepID=A0A225DWB9_9BACT|nr:S26 family signal peptidase [Fimbriiglobus ruber]OWK43854.1 Signal peptidase I [Fimbriiglobus ruber]
MAETLTKPKPAAAPAAAAKPAAAPRDSVREVFETIVFVVALVLMLKLFVVEAFVIPTGSMAETLYGYHKNVTCKECGYTFPVNSSDEVDPQDGVTKLVTGACCPNCRFPYNWVEAAVKQKVPFLDKKPKEKEAEFSPESGDRVLVHKALYHFTPPTRGDVVVFKFPVDPQINFTAQNYIKRLWGLGGETLAIYRGDLYMATGVDYPAGSADSAGRPLYPRPDNPMSMWEGPDVNILSRTRPQYKSPLGNDYTYHNGETALDTFEKSRADGFPGDTGRFGMLRKTDAQALAMRRIVYNNEFQSAHLPPRWGADGNGWEQDNAAQPRTFTHSGGTFGWVRYAHRLSRQMTEEERLAKGGDYIENWGWHEINEGKSYQSGMFPLAEITNFLGYNAGYVGDPGSDGRLPRPPRMGHEYWVGDLMSECTVKVSGPADEVVMELSKGTNRFQARFTGGTVTLTRTGPRGKQLAARPSPITRAGTHALRFANVDCRLRVWVDGTKIDFGTDADYSPSDAAGFDAAIGAVASAAFAPAADGHTLENDVAAPASLGAKGAVEFSKVVLWADTFFTPDDHYPYADPGNPVDTFYVQPGHYLCLGDNSGQSSDSRKWGLVPQRLMLGKAVFVFFPFSRIGFIK